MIEVIRAMINCGAFDFVAEPKMWVGLNSKDENLLLT